MQKEGWFGILCLIIVALITAFYVNQYQASMNGLANGNPQNPEQQNSSVILTAAEIAKHSSVQDCWMIVENKVYAVTNYENMHPGGAARITNNCGKDATVAFDSIKGGQGHSGAADQAHAYLYLGDLNSQANVNLSAAGNVSNIPGSGDEEYEDD